jgi:hypothetical protein
VSKRAWIVVGVVAAVVVASLAAVYLTGLVIVGDPYSGVWNVEGKPAHTGSLIKRTDEGYVFSALIGGEANGWQPLQRHGRTLEFENPEGHRVTFEYQPWTGHLVWTNWDRDQLRGHLTLRKATDDTSVPKPVD